MTRRQLLWGFPSLPTAAVAAFVSTRAPGLPLTDKGAVITPEIWNEVIRTVNKVNGHATPIRGADIIRKGA